MEFYHPLLDQMSNAEEVKKCIGLVLEKIF